MRGTRSRAAAALETLQIVADERLVERSRHHGGVMLAALRQRLNGHPLVARHPRTGLLIAIELRVPLAPTTARIAGQWLALALLEQGIIVQPASQAWQVLGSSRR